MKSKNIVVTCFLDGSANSNKPLAIERVLKARGHNVTLIDTSLLGRMGTKGFVKYLPAINILSIFLYVISASLFLISKTPLKRYLLYYFITMNMKLRAKILIPLLNNYDIVMCESSIDSFIFLKNLGNIIKIYNCATPVADELYYGGKLTSSQRNKFRLIENKVYKGCDHLSFHWHSYADYVKKYYGDPGNIFIFDFTTKNNKKIKYNPNPKIVYLGFLGGYWIDLSLLSRLTKIYPNIDVYGFPKPPSKYGLNYKGRSSTKILKSYQFGLITLSKDKLRREGFSAKHLDYLSFGLPVLMPEWRTSSKDLKGTIYYNEDNFADIVKKYSKKTLWEEISKDAYIQAKKYNAKYTFRELLNIIEKS